MCVCVFVWSWISSKGIKHISSVFWLVCPFRWATKHWQIFVLVVYWCPAKSVLFIRLFCIDCDCQFECDCRFIPRVDHPVCVRCAIFVRLFVYMFDLLLFGVIAVPFNSNVIVSNGITVWNLWITLRLLTLIKLNCNKLLIFRYQKHYKERIWSFFSLSFRSFAQWMNTRKKRNI